MEDEGAVEVNVSVSVELPLRRESRSSSRGRREAAPLNLSSSKGDMLKLSPFQCVEALPSRLKLSDTAEGSPSEDMGPVPEAQAPMPPKAAPMPGTMLGPVRQLPCSSGAETSTFSTPAGGEATAGLLTSRGLLGLFVSHSMRAPVSRPCPHRPCSRSVPGTLGSLCGGPPKMSSQKMPRGFAAK